jgi:hypothetical protein
LFLLILDISFTPSASGATGGARRAHTQSILTEGGSRDKNDIHNFFILLLSVSFKSFKLSALGATVDAGRKQELLYNLHSWRTVSRRSLSALPPACWNIARIGIAQSRGDREDIRVVGIKLENTFPIDKLSSSSRTSVRASEAKS